MPRSPTVAARQAPGYRFELALAAAFLWSAGTATASDPASARQLTGTATVVDGGTLAIDDKTVRLAGIVAPGPRQKCLDGNLPWLCGAAARQHLTGLIGDRPVTCDLARPGLGECRADGTDLGAAMIRDGWAVTGADGSKQYKALEDEAKSARRGLWERLR